MNKTEAVAESYRNAHKSFHGYDINITVKRGGWMWVGDQYVHVHTLAKRAEKIWLALNARNATRSEYTA